MTDTYTVTLFAFPGGDELVKETVRASSGRVALNRVLAGDKARRYIFHRRVSVSFTARITRLRAWRHYR